MLKQARCAYKYLVNLKPFLLLEQKQFKKKKNFFEAQKFFLPDKPVVKIKKAFLNLSFLRISLISIKKIEA